MVHWLRALSTLKHSRRYFFIFDPVHDLKNVYNNFQSQKEFWCPQFGRDLPNGCQADFNHIADLYQHEASTALKQAHKLTLSVLNPTSIEKTSVKLVPVVFAEWTRDSLRFYSVHIDNPEWNGTANFITVVLKLWNVMNIKSATKCKHKRNCTMDPVRSMHDWKLSFLQEFADFLQTWRELVDTHTLSTGRSRVLVCCWFSLPAIVSH